MQQSGGLAIVAHCKIYVARSPRIRQTVMFSATINRAVARSGEEFLKDPITVAVNCDRVEPISIEQKIHLVQEEGKTKLLVSILNGQLDEQSPGCAGSLPAFPDSADKRTAVVFTKTRHRATKIRKILNGANIRAGEIHSDISQNKRESTLKQFRPQSEGHGRPGSDARRDRPQSEGRGRPASEARHFGEKQRGGFDATRAQQESASSGYRRSEQSQANKGSSSFASKPHRTNEGAEAFTSNRAKKYLPQSDFWSPRNERVEPTERTERKQRTDRTDRTQRDERVVVGSGLTAERPKPRFDRFKKKRAEGSSPYGRTEGSLEHGGRAERAEQSGSRKPAGNKPVNNKNSQGKAFEFRGSAKRTSSIISKRTRNSK